MSGIISGLAFGFIGQLSGWLILGTGFMIIFGLMFIHLFGSAYGGVAVTAHFLLRVLLWRTGSFPWGYIDFLDYAAERILLRKIGGGYMFVHIQLRDYFATLVPPTAKVNSSTGESSLPLEEVCR